MQAAASLCGYGDNGQTTRYIDVNQAHINTARRFRDNSIRTHKYTILTFLPYNLIEQFRR